MKKENIFNTVNIDKRFSYRETSLYKRRRLQLDQHDAPLLRERLFQLMTDYQYSIFSINLGELENKNIMLLCLKADGFGDIAHTFYFADMLQKKFNNNTVQIFIECTDSDVEKIKQIFPVDNFKNIQFFSLYTNFYEKEEIFSEIKNKKGCFLGIAVPLESVEICKSPVYRMLREYGYGHMSQVCEPNAMCNNLSMGFSLIEEGLHFPSTDNLRLCDIENQQLKNLLGIYLPSDEDRYHQTHKLYYMYIQTHLWEMQMIALYSSAIIEKGNPQSVIDVFLLLDLNYSLKDFMQWGVLAVDFLKENNIGEIVRVTSTGTESITLGAGKTIRIINLFGHLYTKDIWLLEQNSEPFFGCSGDLSLSAAISRNKLPVYANPGLKDTMMNDWIEIVKNQEKYTELVKFLELLKKWNVECEAIYRKHTPKKVSFYQPPASMDLSDPYSVPRKSLPELAPKILNYAKELASLYLQTSLLEQAKSFNAYAVENLNVASRLIHIVYRGLILSNYPDLIAVEKKLHDKFLANEMNEEEVVERLSQAIQNVCVEKMDVEHYSRTITP